MKIREIISRTALISIIAILQTAIAEAQENNRGYLVQVGDVAPDFKMELFTGETIKLSDLRGKVVMLQFTASWCSVCRKEMPYIEEEIWQVLKDNDEFALYGIDRDEPLHVVQDFVKKTGITYPVALDPGAEIFKLFAHEKAGITRNVIVNRSGKIVYLTRLFDHEEFKGMKEKIFDLLSAEEK